MRTSQEIADEVWRRVEIITRREESVAKKARVFLMAAACFWIAAALPFAVFPAIQDTSVADAFLYSAVMFSDGAAGGYVLTAVISIALGAAVTLLCVKKAGKSDR